MIELLSDGEYISDCIMPEIYETEISHFRCAGKYKSIYTGME